MRLGYITRAFPFAHLGETFLAPEIRTLARACTELHVIPVRPRLRRSVLAGEHGASYVRIGAASVRTLRDACVEAATHPRLTAFALWQVLAPRYRVSAKLKNLAVFPAALAIARYVRTHSIEHLHAHWLTTPATAAYVASLLTRVPWSCTAHAHDIFSDNLIRQKLESAAFVRVIAERNMRHLANTAGPRAKPMELIHVGVEIPQPARREVAIRPLQIVCAARLDPIKGHEHLIRALAFARESGLEFHCDIVGDGPEERRLRALAARLQMNGAVTFRGMVPNGVLLQELGSGRYDVLVLASLELGGVGQHEGIPVALIEAMAQGVPCVATATGCIPELIDERTGILVRQRDAYELSDAFVRLARDPDLRERLGEAARARVIAEFNVEDSTEKLCRLIGGNGTAPNAAAAASCARN